MAMNWEDRLTKVVQPALLAGVSIYTGFGELHPGPGVSKEAEGKPAGLPQWQVYLGEKNERGVNQPAIRFIQFTHKVRNPMGSAFQVYPSNRDDKLGQPLALPLGEGLSTPPAELLVARDLQASIMYRPVFVIAIGRNRFLHTLSSQPFSEPIIMEVYSEHGAVLWTNPYLGMNLEEAIQSVQSAMVVRTRPPQDAPAPAPVPAVVPHAVPAQGPAEPTGQAVADRRQIVEADFRNFLSQGMPDEEIRSLVARTRGLDIRLAGRLLDDYKKRNEPSAEVQAKVRSAAEEAREFYTGEEFIEAIVDMTGLGMDIVRRVLAMPRPLLRPTPRPHVPAPVQVAAAGPVEEEGAAPAEIGDTEGMLRALDLKAPLPLQGSVTIAYEGAEIPAGKKTRPSQPVPRAPRAPKTPSPGSDDERVANILRELHQDQEHYQRRVQEYLATVPKAQPSEIRAALGLPPGSIRPWKSISDGLRRIILAPLQMQGRITCEGDGRTASYRLVKHSI